MTKEQMDYLLNESSAQECEDFQKKITYEDDYSTLLPKYSSL